MGSQSKRPSNEARRQQDKFPPFAEFVKFVTEIAEVQCLPVLTNLDTSLSAREDKNRGFREEMEVVGIRKQIP